MPRNFIDALSVSPKREKRYPRHMNGFHRLHPPSLRWETFIPAVPPTCTTGKSRKTLFSEEEKKVWAEIRYFQRREPRDDA